MGVIFSRKDPPALEYWPPWATVLTLPQCGPHHGLQGTHCAGGWSTSAPSFLHDLGVHRIISCVCFSSPSLLCFLLFCLFKNILPSIHHQRGWSAQLCSSWIPHVGIWDQPHPATCTPALCSHRGITPNALLGKFKITFLFFPQWLHVPSYLIMNLKEMML